MSVVKLPRGIRLNNVLNIRHSADRWEGLAPDQPDSEFCKFVSLEMGIRAAALNLQAQGRHLAAEGQPVCVATLIARWAPPAENDVAAYALDVMKRMGAHLTKQIDLHDAATLQGLIAAMARHENGVDLPPDPVRRGVAMALNHSAAPAAQLAPGGAPP